MQKILVSACLLGEPVRYNGSAATSDDERVAKWVSEGRVVSFCPEVASGLGTPRPRAERRGLRIVTETGTDVTSAFALGAEQARDTARRHGIRIAILKDASPSCGSTVIADGTFAGRRVPGRGVTTELLERDGICVFSEHQIDEAAAFLAALERAGPRPRSGEGGPVAPKPRRGEGG